MKKKRKTTPRRDFRGHVFTATGKDTDIKNLSLIDLFDNLIVELDRLNALADLLGCCPDPIEPRTAGGIELLVKDCTRRAEAILRTFLGKGGAEPEEES